MDRQIDLLWHRPDVDSRLKGKGNTTMKMQKHIEDNRAYMDVCRMYMTGMFSSPYSTRSESPQVVNYVINHMVASSCCGVFPPGIIRYSLIVIHVCIHNRFNNTNEENCEKA